MKATQLLYDEDQSLWLDNITRDLLNIGTLKQYIDELSITGLTSNPTIFDHAIKNSATYDPAIIQKVKRGISAEALFFELAIEDLTRAADLFQPIHEKTNGVDGWVSLEVSPLLAYDTASTLAAAKGLFAQANLPNLFIKIPGTKQSLPAVEEAIFAGIPINVTLLFSHEQYLAAAEAYLLGIERRVEARLNPRVDSVASVFVSRWDAAVATKVPEKLRNQLGIAIAKRTYKASSAQLCALATYLQPRRSPTTSPVGQHGNQRSQSFRRALRQRPGCAIHREHHARGNIEGAGDSRRIGRIAADRRRKQRRSFGAVCQSWYRC
jgi:transaldolase